MSKTLVIAEKPSVANDLARALGKFEKQKDYLENDQFIISSAVGHLIEISAPEEEEPKKGKWQLQNLPVIPSHFVLTPIEDSASRFHLLKRLLKRDDVEAVINACDAGREGELIFRYIYQAVGCRKPIKRLWLQSMTKDAICENFAHLRSDEEMLPLAEAAVCRSESDWLVGINGTRALTAFNSIDGGFQKTTVGRVQTPTLSLMVARELKIRKFVPKNYWEIHAQFQAAAGLYEGRWFDESFKKPTDGGEHAADLKAERIWDEAGARKIVEACRGRVGVAEEESKPATQAPPLLYDLTTLQREANSRFGFPARMTLSIAQSLYEKHKALTYPRTDSRYLPEDYPSTVKNTLKVISSTYLGSFASKILAQGWVRPANKRVFNQAKVSDHFAIIPTPNPPDKLTETEQKIYDMVSRRFLAVFFPTANFEVTTRITRIDEHAFKSEGKVLKEAGWLEVYGKSEQVEDEGEKGDKKQPSLPAIQPREKVLTKEIQAEGLATRPPARFSEATLLSAMEGAGKLVEDEELREAMAEKGLGTPATRAAIIEGLLLEKYITRELRELVPTAKAFHLFETLEAMKIPTLSSPELTGDWEYQLKQVEQGKLSRETFMNGIRDMTRSIVTKVKSFKEDETSRHVTDLFDPVTQQNLVETLRDYRSPDGKLVVRKAIAGRIMSQDEVRQLLEKRQIGPLDGFRSRMGRTFSAAIKIDAEQKVLLDWGGDASATSNEKPDFSAMEVVGTCPRDGAKVYQASTAYICENSCGKNASCKFKIFSRILNMEIQKDQVVKLLATGKTDLLEGFVSQRTRKPFKAWLILKDGEVKFDFPPRPAPKNGKGRFGQPTSANGKATEQAPPDSEAAPSNRAKGPARKTRSSKTKTA